MTSGWPANSPGSAGEDAHRGRLRADPEALREHLRGRMTLPPYVLGERLGEPRARALELLIGGGGPPRPVERAALEALAGDDPLDPRGETPTTAVCDALDAVAEHHRQQQHAHTLQLAGRHGDGPALRHALAQLDDGQLLTAAALQDLERRAASDQRATVLQTQRRIAYAQRRPREARRLARQAGAAAQLAAQREHAHGLPHRAG
jgi:hypothetical protein